MIVLTALSLPYMRRLPLDLPPIVSVELIQITDKTSLPFAPKAKKILEKIKKEKERVVSEQAPPKLVKKEKPDAIPLPEKKDELKKKIETDKQNPEKIKGFPFVPVGCFPQSGNRIYGAVVFTDRDFYSNTSIVF